MSFTCGDGPGGSCGSSGGTGTDTGCSDVNKYSAECQPGGGGGSAPPDGGPSVVRTVYYPTELILLDDGTAAINGYVLPPGHPDPEELAQEVDNYVGEKNLKVEELDLLARVYLIDDACRGSRNAICSHEFHMTVKRQAAHLRETLWIGQESYDEFWLEYGNGVVLTSGLVTAGVCIFSAGVGCAVLVGTTFVINVSDKVFKYNRSPKAWDDKACLYGGIAYDIVTLGMPKSRVPDVSLPDSPFNKFVAGSTLEGTNQVISNTVVCL